MLWWLLGSQVDRARSDAHAQFARLDRVEREIDSAVSDAVASLTLIVQSTALLNGVQAALSADRRCYALHKSVGYSVGELPIMSARTGWWLGLGLGMCSLITCCCSFALCSDDHEKKKQS